jgi:hypothetical protein
MENAGMGDIAWLDITPKSGTVVPVDSASILLSFDSSSLTPGECYTGTVDFEYNDPYTIEEFIPAELCITYTADLGRIYLPIIQNE